MLRGKWLELHPKLRDLYNKVASANSEFVSAEKSQTYEEQAGIIMEELTKDLQERDELRTALEVSRKVAEIQKVQIEALERLAKEKSFNILKKCYDEVRQKLSDAEKKIEALTDMLKKCSPTNGFGNCFSCGLRFDTIYMDRNNEHKGHKPDCAYIKVIGGNTDV